MCIHIYIYIYIYKYIYIYTHRERERYNEYIYIYIYTFTCIPGQAMLDQVRAQQDRAADGPRRRPQLARAPSGP